MRENLNYFGEKIYSITEILSDEKLIQIIEPTFIKMCEELSISEEIADEIFKLMIMYSLDSTIPEIESKLHIEFKKVVNQEIWLKALDRRASKIFEEIKEFIKGKRISDIGCGDGLVSYKLNDKHLSIKMFDVQNYVLKKIDLPFFYASEEKSLPIDLECDTSLLLTVLHHSEKPIELLESVLNLTRSRCLIIESVTNLLNIGKNIESPMSRLNTVEQYKYASFWDWFYNRIIHQDVNVPYNYLSPQRWIEQFEKLGWRVSKSIELGIDQPLVPEHHYLFVLDRKSEELTL